MDSTQKIKNLLVGDGSIENHLLACEYFNEPVYLLDNLMYDNLDYSLSYHTSLADLELDKLLHVVEITNNLKFGIFENFKHNNEVVVTNSIMYSEKHKNYNNCLGENINLNPDEIVFIGCSHTEGIGVENDQRFGHLVSQELGLKERNFAIGGTGIWQMHDTFFRCNFHKNQKVVLQLTDPYRFNYFQSQSIKHDSFKNINDKKLILTYNDQILAYQEYSLISAIISASKNYNIDLVCFRMSNLLPIEYNESDYLISSNTKSFILGKWLDLGNDKIHAGPLTNQKISSLIIKKFKGIT